MSLKKIFLAVLAMCIIGTNTTFSKVGLSEFPPLLFSFFRFLFISPLAIFIPRPKITWKLLFLIALTVGCLQIALVNIGLYLGASAASTSFIIQSGSLFAILFAYFILKSKPTLFDFLGIALGSFGLILIFSEKNLSGNLTSLSFCLASAVMWGLGYTLVKKANSKALPITAWMSALITPFLALLSYLFEDYDQIIHTLFNASSTAWASAFFSSWVSMLGAGAILMHLMQTEEIAKVVPFNMLIPIFGTLTAFLFLNEPLTLTTIIGGSWILLGIITTQFAKPLWENLRNKAPLN